MRSRLLRLCSFALAATLTVGSSSARARAVEDGAEPPQGEGTAGADPYAPGNSAGPAAASTAASRAPAEDTAPPAAAKQDEKPAGKPAEKPPEPLADKAPAPSAATAPPSSPAPAATGGPYAFREVERRVGDLKDQVHRSKARLSLLTETLLRTNQGSTRIAIVHKNQMGLLFVPVRVTYQLDGRVVFDRRDDSGATLGKKEQVVWEGGLKAGDHTLGVEVVYRGNGSKVFAYYDKYTFTAHAAQRITTSEGETTRVHVVCYEKGNALTKELKDRPAFDFRVNPPEPGSTSGGASAARP